MQFGLDCSGPQFGECERAEHRRGETGGGRQEGGGAEGVRGTGAKSMPRYLHGLRNAAVASNPANWKWQWVNTVREGRACTPKSQEAVGRTSTHVYAALGNVAQYGGGGAIGGRKCRKTDARYGCAGNQKKEMGDERARGQRCGQTRPTVPHGGVTGKRCAEKKKLWTKPESNR